MRHWTTLFPERIFQLKYEQLIWEFETTARSAIEFCGLEWDQACQEFYKNERPISTASHWQARQPIYSTSIGRWRAYAAFLGPLTAALYPERKSEAELD